MAAFGICIYKNSNLVAIQYKKRMISAIILAAGSSSRMGNNNKLLLPWKESTIIGTIVDLLIVSEAGEILVVTGFEEEDVRNQLKGRPVEYFYNEHFEGGMTSSIQCGVKNAGSTSDGYLICLSDMPQLETEDYNRMIRAFSSDKKQIYIPEHNGKNGNPVLFSSHFKNAIIDHGEPEGCKGIVKENRSLVTRVAYDNDRILRDIDTREDYQMD